MGRNKKRCSISFASPAALSPLPVVRKVSNVQEIETTLDSICLPDSSSGEDDDSTENVSIQR